MKDETEVPSAVTVSDKKFEGIASTQQHDKRCSGSEDVEDRKQADGFPLAVEEMKGEEEKEGGADVVPINVAQTAAAAAASETSMIVRSIVLSLDEDAEALTVPSPTKAVQQHSERSLPPVPELPELSGPFEAFGHTAQREEQEKSERRGPGRAARRVRLSLCSRRWLAYVAKQMLQAIRAVASYSMEELIELTAVLVGMLLAMVAEMDTDAPRYNLSLLVGVMLAQWVAPRKLRFFFFMTGLVVLSTLLDLAYLITFRPISELSDIQRSARIFTVLVIPCKYVKLYFIVKRSRARKYLWRRLRLFLPTPRVPRKITREVRHRLLALEMIHFGCCVILLVLFVVSMQTLSYDVPFASNPGYGVPLNVVLLAKAVTTFAMFAVLYDQTDTRLCLHYFGCYCLCMGSIRKYWQQKRRELGDVPEALTVAPSTFCKVYCCKAADLAVGLLGWVSAGPHLGSVFYSYGESAKATLVTLVCVLAITDVWSSLLVAVIARLFSQYKVNREIDAAAAEDSSDSELEETHVSRPKRDAANATQEAQAELEAATLDVTVLLDTGYRCDPEAFGVAWQEWGASGELDAEVLTICTDRLLVSHLQRKGHSVVSTEQGGEGFLRIHSACHATLYSEHHPAREATLLMELVKRQEGARLFLQCTFKCDVPEQTRMLVDMLDLDDIMTFISASPPSRPFV